MPPTSWKTYLLAGVKISLDVVEDFSNDLPAPASSIVNFIQRIIETVEVSAAVVHAELIRILNRPRSSLDNPTKSRRLSPTYQPSLGSIGRCLEGDQRLLGWRQ